MIFPMGFSIMKELTFHTESVHWVVDKMCNILQTTVLPSSSFLRSAHTETKYTDNTHAEENMEDPPETLDCARYKCQLFLNVKAPGKILNFSNICVQLYLKDTLD